MCKSSIFLRSIITIIFLIVSFPWSTLQNSTGKWAFLRNRILNYFRLIKRRPLLWNQNGLQITPCPPPPLPKTHCGSQYVAAEPGRARRQRCYYIMKHAAQAQGRGGRRGDQKETTKSQAVWGSVRGGQGARGRWRHSQCGGGDRGGCLSGERTSQPCGLRR